MNIMKQIKILALSALAATALVSCELKDELKGGGGPSETGALELSLAVSVPTGEAEAATKATDDVTTFPVSIVNAETQETVKSWSTYAEITGPVVLPVGAYTVKAHTPGDIQKVMAEPYYGGSEDLVITQGVTSQVSMECTPMNIRVKLGYSADFKTTFKSWDVTLDDGQDNTLTFTQESSDAAVYWYLEGQVSTLTLNVTAVNQQDETVRFQKTFTKADADNPYSNDNPYFTGGDALDITLNVEGEVDVDNPEIGIGVTVDITFSNTDETVEIPVDEEDPTPDNPDDGGDTPEPTGDITITDNGTGYLKNGVTVTGTDYPDDVAVVMNVKNKIKSVFVKIETTNDTFKGMVADMGLVDGDGMDLASEAASSLSTFFQLPQADATEYTFTMSETLFGLLGNFAGKHDFSLTVIDQEGNQESATLTINMQ